MGRNKHKKQKQAEIHPQIQDESEKMPPITGQIEPIKEDLSLPAVSSTSSIESLSASTSFVVMPASKYDAEAAFKQIDTEMIPKQTTLEEEGQGIQIEKSTSTESIEEPKDPSNQATNESTSKEDKKEDKKEEDKKQEPKEEDKKEDTKVKQDKKWCVIS
jgi:hypothetical protein